MLIVCPTCASEFNVDATHLGSEGRRVRCFNCQSHWFAQPAMAFARPPSVAGGDDALSDDPLDDDPLRDDPLGERSTQQFLDDEWLRGAGDDAGMAETAHADPAAGANDRTTAGATDAAGMTAATRETQDGAEAGSSADNWHGKTALPQTEPPQAASPRRKPAGRGSRAAAKPKVSRPVQMQAGGWAIIGSLVLAMGVWQRDVLVRVAPALAGPFERIGLSVNIRGLEFDKVTSELVSDPSGRFLVVQSQVRNVTSRQVNVPMIEIVVRDAGARPVYTWAAEPPKNTLAPGEALSFRTRLAAPPQDGNDVVLRFQRTSGQMAMVQNK